MSDTRLPPSHLAFVIPNLRGGGAERVVLNLAEGLLRHGHKVDLLLSRPEISYPREIPKQARLFLLQKNPDQQDNPSLLDEHGRLVQLDAVIPTLSQIIQMMKALKWNPLAVPRIRLFRRTATLAAYWERENPDYVFPNLPSAKTATLLTCHLVRNAPPDHSNCPQHYGEPQHQEQGEISIVISHGQSLYCCIPGRRR